MRVAMIGPFGLRPKGTMSVRALPLARALVARGHTVRMILPAWDFAQEAGSRWQDTGVEIENIELAAGLPGWFHVSTTRRMVHRALDFQPDVIHCFKPKAYAGRAAWWPWQMKRAGRVRARLIVDTDDWEGAGGWNDLGSSESSVVSRQASGVGRQYSWAQRNTFVKAVGRYIQEREVRKFEVDSWSPDVEPVYVTGTLHRDGDQVILTLDDGSGNQYPLMDPPENLPLDTDSAVSQLALDGVFTDEKMDWKTISYYADASQFGGGGGGGGMGFYQLNLSGTPVPFPTPAAQSGSGTVPTEYIVKEGDTLASIGSVFGISLEDLVQANGLNDQMVISVGQRLVIPSRRRTRLKFSDRKAL